MEIKIRVNDLFMEEVEYLVNRWEDVLDLNLSGEIEYLPFYGGDIDKYKNERDLFVSKESLIKSL